ncbi:MAG: histone deacetylase, partial [Verrucomicrobiota bacterium]|nr:histone deacetylase [Verrucomicrobiota bacterium]
MPTVFIADAACKTHDPGAGHPEQPRRFDAVLEAVQSAGLLEKMTRLATREVSADDLRLVHTPEYLELAEREIRAGADVLSTGDTSVAPASWNAARTAVGSALAAVDAVLAGPAQTAFCLVRPPGHHASAGRGMGFCVLNNIAIAARHAQRRHSVGKVLIVDWDVHHGNGSQDVFYEDGAVFFFSTHQWPWYPGTGRAEETGSGAGEGTTLNCPLRALSGRKEIFACFEGKLLPAMEKFKPELVLISA